MLLGFEKRDEPWRPTTCRLTNIVMIFSQIQTVSIESCVLMNIGVVYSNSIYIDSIGLAGVISLIEVFPFDVLDFGFYILFSIVNNMIFSKIIILLGRQTLFML